MDVSDAAQTIESGTWVYDDAVPFPVSIVAFPFDYWSELGPADYQDEPIEPTPIGADGLLYYVSFGVRRVDSAGFVSVGEAKAEAQRCVPGVITWSARD